MKSVVKIMIVVAALVVSVFPALADEYISYSTADETITFDYPEGWEVFDEQGILALVSNTAVLDKVSAEELESGDLLMTMFLLPHEMSEMVGIMGEDAAELATAFASLMVDPEAEVDVLGEAELVEHTDETILGTIEIEDELVDVMVVAFAPAEDVYGFALITAFSDELSDNQDAVFQTLASLSIE